MTFRICDTEIDETACAEIHDLCSSTVIIRVITTRRIRWAGHAARMGKVGGTNGILVGKPERKELLGKPRRRW